MEIIRQLARLMGRKNPQYESLTEYNAGDYKIRIWRTAKTLQQAKEFDHAAFRASIVQVTETRPADTWFESLMKLPNVACVAIVDPAGNGASAYPDWF